MASTRPISQNPPEVTIVRDIQGNRVLSTYLPIRTLSWQVFVEQPLGEAFAPLYFSLLRTGLLLIVGFVLSVAASMFLARRMVTPIRALQASAARIGAGALDQSIKVDTGDELEALAEEFNRMSARLRESYANLEQQVEDRTADLVKTNEQLHVEIFEREQAQEELAAFTAKLQQSNRELQDFASVAAHDLQEPLRKIQAFGNRLETKCSDMLSEQGRDYLSRMLDAATRMRSLIDDLQTFSRVTTQGQPFVRVDLTQVIQEVLSDLEVSIEDVGGTVEVDGLPTLDADPLQMRQLFQNIIGNALKYHLPGRPPVVKVHGQFLNGHAHHPEGSPPAQGSWQITVEDNGIGFDEKYLDRLFVIFQRLHGRGEYDGNGVGLAICRKIAERHGGSITAESTQGEGSTFIVTVPITHSEGESA